MRTIKATFSGGGFVYASYETSFTPHAIDSGNIPGIDPRALSRPSIGALYGILEQHAKEIGETVEFEDDGGPLMAAFR